MATSDLAGVITGIGMVSSLGHDAASACAAARAGIRRISKLNCLNFEMSGEFGGETMDGPAEVSGHCVSGIGNGFVGDAKAVELGVEALRDLFEVTPLSEREWRQTAILVNANDNALERLAAAQERREAEVGAALSASVVQKPSTALQGEPRAERDALPVLAMLRQAVHGAELSPGAGVWLMRSGDIGGSKALLRALELLESGLCERVIVGGVDSFVEPRRLMAAQRLGLLRVADNPVGFLPGEGASFVLLERQPGAGRHGLVQLGQISLGRGEALLHESTAPDGSVLGAAIASVAAEHRPSLLVSDFDGTARRAQDLSLALGRLPTKQKLGAPLQTWLPVECFGTLGAAYVPIALCLLTRGVARGYAALPAVVVTTSLEGERAALSVHRYCPERS